MLASVVLKSSAGRRLAIGIVAAALLSAIPGVQATSPARAHLDAVPTAGGGWLDRLNQWRASANLPILTENTVWSNGDYLHSQYMVKNDLVTHYETVGTPYYTTEGDTAARNSNIEVNSTTSFTDEQSIDWWMKAPFHAMGMMDPRLTQTGFGAYREVKSGWQAGFSLDVLRGNSFTGGSFPVFFPGNGSTEPLTSYTGGEFPDPLQGCAGYSAPSGLPLFIEVGGNVATTAGPVHTLTGNGTPLEHCVIDSTNPAVGSNLKGRGGVIIVPRQPLQAGVAYVVTLTVNGTPYTWSFTVGSPTTPPAPQVVTPPAGWESLGGILTSSPGASSWGATRADVFVRGSDNSLFQKTWNGTSWSNWYGLGGVLTASPSSASWSANRIDAFVRGSDNQLYHKWWDGASWSYWEAQGGILTSSPTVASWGANRLDVFVRGTDNALWHKWWDGAQWSWWENLGGILTADPAAVSWGPNRLDVLVRGTDNGLWRKSWDGRAWSSWQALGGVLTSAPTAAACVTGHLDVFVLGSDGAVYQLPFKGAWGSWQRLGGQWSAGPAAACRPSTTVVDLFERAYDSALWHTTLVGS